MRPFQRRQRQLFFIVQGRQNERLLDGSAQPRQSHQIGGFQRFLVLIHALHDEEGVEPRRIARVNEEITAEFDAVRHE